MWGGELGGARRLRTIYAIVRHLRPLGSLWLTVPNRAQWYTIGDGALLWRPRRSLEVSGTRTGGGHLRRECRARTICAIMRHLRPPGSLWSTAPNRALVCTMGDGALLWRVRRSSEVSRMHNLNAHM